MWIVRWFLVFVATIVLQPPHRVRTWVFSGRIDLLVLTSTSILIGFIYLEAPDGFFHFNSNERQWQLSTFTIVDYPPSEWQLNYCFLFRWISMASRNACFLLTSPANDVSSIFNETFIIREKINDRNGRPFLCRLNIWMGGSCVVDWKKK